MFKKGTLKIYRGIIQRLRKNGIAQKLHDNKTITKMHESIVKSLVKNEAEIDGMIFKTDIKDETYLTTKGFNKPLLRIIKNIIYKDSISVDVGANLGVISSTICKLQTEGKIYSFEPDKRNYELLKINMERNCKINNYELINGAAGEIDGEIPFYESQDNMADSNGRNNKGNTLISCTRLDSYFEGKEKEIDFIKIDVEGMEVKVLRGMENIIKLNEQMIIIIEYFPQLITEAGDNIEEYFLRLKEYNIYEIDGEKDALRNFNIEEFKKLYTDLLCVRKQH